jgi:hypothetical protein
MTVGMLGFSYFVIARNNSKGLKTERPALELASRGWVETFSLLMESPSSPRQFEPICRSILFGLRVLSIQRTLKLLSEIYQGRKSETLSGKAWKQISKDPISPLSQSKPWCLDRKGTVCICINVPKQTGVNTISEPGFEACTKKH